MLAGLQSKEKAASPARKPTASVKAVYITNRLDGLVKRTGVTRETPPASYREADPMASCSQVTPLPFDDGTLAGKTVGDVLGRSQLLMARRLPTPSRASPTGGARQR